MTFPILKISIAGAKRLRKVNPDADMYLPKKKEDSLR